MIRRLTIQDSIDCPKLDAAVSVACLVLPPYSYEYEFYDLAMILIEDICIVILEEFD